MSRYNKTRDKKYKTFYNSKEWKLLKEAYKTKHPYCEMCQEEARKKGKHTIQLTEEKYLQQVNRVIDYINSHLNEPLRVETLAREVCLSEYHFHRIMRAYLHEPLATYIARQRVERAVMYLQMKNIRLAQVAEMVGYETPQSLSKAFKQFFGISPTAYRKRRAERYEEFSTLKKESLKPEILTEPELKLVYIRIIGRYGEEEPYIEAWRKLRDFLQINGLLTPSTRWIGISFDDPTVTKTEQCRFYACATVEHDVSPQGAFGMKTIPQGRYAVYTLRGSYSGLQEMYDRIYSHPLPTAFRDATSFEEYLNCESDTEEKDYVTRIYIPIENHIEETNSLL